jgi:hypothetical protein
MTNMVKLVCNGLEKISYIFVTSDWEKYHFAISDFGTYQIRSYTGHCSSYMPPLSSLVSLLLSLSIHLIHITHTSHHSRQQTADSRQQRQYPVLLLLECTRYWPNLVRTKAVVTSRCYGC